MEAERKASYIPRIVDSELDRRLRALGAVVIEGPRACGKTETARNRAASEVLLDLDETARRTIAIDPGEILIGETPRLIDEWQIEPSIWNHVRRAVDDRREPGQFILTGSAVPADDGTRHSGAGRFGRLRMRPMSLLESRLSNASVSLRALLDGEPPRATDAGMGLREVLDAITIGGWPELRDLAAADASAALRDYLEEISRVDVGRVADARHDPVAIERTLRSYARNVGTEAPATTIAADAGGADGPLDSDTTRKYLSALSRVFVIEDLPAWSTHLRSRHTLRKAAKRHFVDPSLAAAALGADPSRLAEDLELVGFLYESLVVRDLRVYSQPLDAGVFHYRDSSGLEVDAIVETRDGRWAAFEVKLGDRRIDEAAANLLRFRDRVDTSKRGEPQSIAVVTNTAYGYRRPDGVDVIPLAAIGP